jgi:chromosome partitioning protein
MIDTPPAMTAAIQAVIAQADLVVIPVKPSPHDLRAVGGTVALAEAENKPFLFALTQAKATARLTAQAVAALSAHGPVAPAFIIDRVDYAASMIDGRTVGELSAKSAAAQEISDLWQQVKARLKKAER